MTNTRQNSAKHTSSLIVACFIVAYQTENPSAWRSSTLNIESLSVLTLNALFSTTSLKQKAASRRSAPCCCQEDLDRGGYTVGCIGLVNMAPLEIPKLTKTNHSHLFQTKPAHHYVNLQQPKQLICHIYNGEAKMASVK